VPLGSLECEHRVMAAVLDALEFYGVELARSQHADRADLNRFVEFFGELADIAHHEKEEDILLPILFKHGLAWDHGALRHVREDHQQERYLMRVLAQAAAQEGTWSDEDRRHLAASIQGYLAFQRTHLRNEDAALYPAARRLPAPAQRELSERLSAFDARFGTDRYDALMQLAEELIVKYAAHERTRRAVAVTG
jgi:hemerythrin-like domain-containing protein